MARAGLGWSRGDLGRAASLTDRTVARFEDGEAVQPESVQSMRRALEIAGVTFLDRGNLSGALVPPRVE
jgi:transcriptional regulator with XRE-family HTH domain